MKKKNYILLLILFISFCGYTQINNDISKNKINTYSFVSVSESEIILSNTYSTNKNVQINDSNVVIIGANNNTQPPINHSINKMQPIYNNTITTEITKPKK